MKKGDADALILAAAAGLLAWLLFRPKPEDSWGQYHGNSELPSVDPVPRIADGPPPFDSLTPPLTPPDGFRLTYVGPADSMPPVRAEEPARLQPRSPVDDLIGPRGVEELPPRTAAPQIAGPAPREALPVRVESPALPRSSVDSLLSGPRTATAERAPELRAAQPEQARLVERAAPSIEPARFAEQPRLTVGSAPRLETSSVPRFEETTVRLSAPGVEPPSAPRFGASIDGAKVETEFIGTAEPPLRAAEVLPQTRVSFTPNAAGKFVGGLSEAVVFNVFAGGLTAQAARLGGAAGPVGFSEIPAGIPQPGTVSQSQPVLVQTAPGMSPLANSAALLRQAPAAPQPPLPSLPPAAVNVRVIPPSDTTDNQTRVAYSTYSGSRRTDVAVFAPQGTVVTAPKPSASVPPSNDPADKIRGGRI